MKRNNVLKKAYSRIKKRKGLALGINVKNDVRAHNRKKNKSNPRTRSTKQAA